MLNVTPRPIQRLIVRGEGTAVVYSKPSAESIRLVQTVSPVPVVSNTLEVIDGGNF
jgi:hypothetical protein